MTMEETRCSVVPWFLKPRFFLSKIVASSTHCGLRTSSGSFCKQQVYYDQAQLASSSSTMFASLGQ